MVTWHSGDLRAAVVRACTMLPWCGTAKWQALPVGARSGWPHRPSRHSRLGSRGGGDGVATLSQHEYRYKKKIGALIDGEPVRDTVVAWVAWLAIPV